MVPRCLLALPRGRWSDVPSACRETVKITGSCHPEPAWTGSYQKLYTLYRQLYPALSPAFHQMTGS